MCRYAVTKIAQYALAGIAYEIVACNEGCSDDDSQATPQNPPIPDVSPNDLCEQLAMAEAKAGAGNEIMRNLGDEPRLVSHYGPGPWIKKQHTHTCADGRLLVIHYFHSLSSGANVELKFVR